MTTSEDPIADLQRKLRQLPDAIDGMMQKITERNRAQIEDKNIAQMAAGLDGQGKPIEPYYSPFTVNYKKSIGAVFDRVTLHDKGDFWKGVQCIVHSDGFEMTNTDSKWGELTEKYGDVIDLSPKSIEELREEVYLPELEVEVPAYFTRG